VTKAISKTKKVSNKDLVNQIKSLKVKDDKKQTAKTSEQSTIETKRSDVENTVSVKEQKKAENKDAKAVAKAKLAGIAMRALKNAYKAKNIVPRKKFISKHEVDKDDNSGA
jgi:hypothetical protein